MIKIVKSIPLIIWLKWVFYYFKAKGFSSKRAIGYRSYVLKSTLGKIVRICDDVYFFNSSLAAYSYIGDRCRINNTFIGKFCSISSGVNIGLGRHPTDFVSTNPIFYSTKNQLPDIFAEKDYFIEHKKTYIGNDVWIGANAIILDGVNIGNGAIIAAGSVVDKDVRKFEIVGGIPAKFIKTRFPEDVISTIDNSKWWDWDNERLRKNFKAFHNITDFKKVVNRS